MLDTKNMKNIVCLPQIQTRPLRIEARIQLAQPCLLTLLSWLSSPVSGLSFSAIHQITDLLQKDLPLLRKNSFIIFFHYIRWYWHLGDEPALDIVRHSVAIIPWMAILLLCVGLDNFWPSYGLHCYQGWGGCLELLLPWEERDHGCVPHSNYLIKGPTEPQIYTQQMWQK